MSIVLQRMRLNAAVRVVLLSVIVKVALRASIDKFGWYGDE